MTNYTHLEVLLVEDNPRDAELTLRALKRRNLANNVIHAKDGQEALDYLFGKGEFAGRDVHNTPLVILLDLKLPRVDGLQVLKVIKADERTKAVPVVVLTSSHEESDLVRSYELGVNSYIVKPVEFESFSEAVSNLGYYWLLLNQAPTL